MKLRDHVDRMHFSDTDGAVFDAYRELIEEVASEAHDAEGPFDEHGRILVTSEALARVTRSPTVEAVSRMVVVFNSGTVACSDINCF